MSRDKDHATSAHDFDIEGLARFLHAHFGADAEMEAARRITAHMQFNEREIAEIWEQVLEEVRRQAKEDGRVYPEKLRLTTRSSGKAA